MTLSPRLYVKKPKGIDSVSEFRDACKRVFKFPTPASPLCMGARVWASFMGSKPSVPLTKWVNTLRIFSEHSDWFEAAKNWKSLFSTRSRADSTVAGIETCPWLIAWA